jgi:HEAT repeat protein
MDTNLNIGALISGLHDEREGLRQFALRRIVKMGTQMIPALIDTLKDNKEYTVECAAIALASFGPASVQPLLAAMKHENRKIRWNAAWVLQSMGPEVRNAVPEVIIPGKMTLPKGSGVWSDAWLTKVKAQLNAAKSGESPAVGFASV